MREGVVNSEGGGAGGVGGGGSSGGGAERTAVRMNGSCGGRFQPTTRLPQQPCVVSIRCRSREGVGAELAAHELANERTPDRYYPSPNAARTLAHAATGNHIYSLRNVAVCNDRFTIVCHHLFTITLITTFHTSAITLANTRRSLGGTSAKLRSCGSTHTW